MAVGFSSMFFSGLASAFRLVIDLKVNASLLVGVNYVSR